MDVVLKFNKMLMLDDDARSVRRWGWLMENEPGFSVEFLPGSENGGPNLLSRPVLDGSKNSNASHPRGHEGHHLARAQEGSLW